MQGSLLADIEQLMRGLDASRITLLGLDVSKLGFFAELDRAAKVRTGLGDVACLHLGPSLLPLIRNPLADVRAIALTTGGIRPWMR
jgi:hypothetical protein